MKRKGFRSTALRNPYRQLNEINEIIAPLHDNTGGLYLGNAVGANDQVQLRQIGVKAVLTVAAYLNVQYSNDITHKIIQAKDIPQYNLGRYFDIGVKFIRNNLKKGNVYVHCHAGVSRSGAMVIAYVTQTLGMDVKEAFKYVKQRRRWVGPNPGFMKQLQSWYVKRKYTVKAKQKIKNSKNYEIIKYRNKNSFGNKNPNTAKQMLINRNRKDQFHNDVNIKDVHSLHKVKESFNFRDQYLQEMKTPKNQQFPGKFQKSNHKKGNLQNIRPKSKKRKVRLRPLNKNKGKGGGLYGKILYGKSLVL